MTNSTLIKRIQQAQESYALAVNSFSVDDLLNGNDEKCANVDAALSKLDSLECTLAVRQEAVKFSALYRG